LETAEVTMNTNHAPSWKNAMQLLTVVEYGT